MGANTEDFAVVILFTLRLVLTNVLCSKFSSSSHYFLSKCEMVFGNEQFIWHQNKGIHIKIKSMV